MMVFLHILVGWEGIVKHACLIANEETFLHTPVWNMFVLNTVNGFCRFVFSGELKQAISNMFNVIVWQIPGISI